MSMENTKVIDFEIIKEPWNMYQIIDNSVLKTRTVLKKIEIEALWNKLIFFKFSKNI